MDIRFVRENETERIKEIWRYCFNDKENFVEWYFKKKYNASNTIAVCEDGVPVANLQLLPYRVKFRGREMDVSYLVGAATLPEAREKGYMDALLKEAIKVLHERGHCINLLLPFQYAFYRRYGWETCYYHLSYELEITDVRPLAKKYGILRPFCFEKDIDAVSTVYNAFIKDRHGCILRSKKDWEGILTDHSMEGGKVYLLFNEQGMPEGYILYFLQSPVFKIHELGYSNRDAYRGLLWFAASHSAQAQKISWKAPSDDLAYIFIAEPRRQIVHQPFVMVRVIDVQKVLSIICGTAGQVDEFIMEIEDPIAEWNSGKFAVRSGQAERIEEGEANLKCSINTFSQLAMGFISVEQAYQAGVLQAADEDSIAKAGKFFTKCNNSINDYY